MIVHFKASSCAPRELSTRWSTSSLATEVTRVAREVGTEGKLGGQAKVKSLAGTWKDLTAVFYVVDATKESHIDAGVAL